MRLRLSIVAIAACAFGFAPQARGGSAGERFVPPELPEPDRWERLEDPSRPETWLFEERGNERDRYRVDVLRGSSDSLAETRRTLDAPGKASCKSFDTTTLRDTPVNGYGRLLWRTDCVKADGSKGTFLNLALRGRDALYLATKIWQFDVAQEEVDAWTRRFERSFVCDSRREDRRCPEGGRSER